jgi:starvation-inducible outer membrane lipoprotein
MNEKYLKYVRQNRKKVGFFIVIFTFFIALGITIPNTIQSSSSLTPLNSIVWVAGDGSENFTCDGSDDQVEINQAFAYVA